MAQKAQAVEQAIIEQVGRGGVKQKIQALLVPALVLAAKLQLRYGTYPSPCHTDPSIGFRSIEICQENAP